jgi:hypothetical protein
MALTRAFPSWMTLRFLAGVASAFVLVGVSSWVLPLLAAHGRAAWAGWVYSGVGIGISAAGLVGLATGVLERSPGVAWLLLGACSAAVAILCWTALDRGTPVAAPSSDAPRAPLSASTVRLVLAYGAFGFGYIVPATFLPAAARQLVPDPAVFAWTWPVFGLAAAVSTVAVSRSWRDVPPRRTWAAAQVVMAAGVLLPAVETSVLTLLLCALAVGGTFMVVTMAGLQEARRVAGASAPRLIAAMTAAFAVGQLVGPYTVTSLGPGVSAGLARPHAIAAAVLLLGLAALLLGAAPARATRPLEPGERT